MCTMHKMWDADVVLVFCFELLKKTLFNTRFKLPAINVTCWNIPPWLLSTTQVCKDTLPPLFHWYGSMTSQGYRCELQFCNCKIRQSNHFYKCNNHILHDRRRWSFDYSYSSRIVVRMSIWDNLLNNICYIVTNVVNVMQAWVNALLEFHSFNTIGL